jgi:CheY-like chemotaxis protein
MPYMDGPSLLEVLRSYRRFHALPVVVFTGVSEGPLAERARQLNISAMFTKGNATLQEIKATVEQALRPTPLQHADAKPRDGRPTV